MFRQVPLSDVCAKYLRDEWQLAKPKWIWVTGRGRFIGRAHAHVEISLGNPDDG
jgi:hypothetical protein